MYDYFFVGKAGSGKSSCTKYLQEKYGYTITKFAHPVYAIAQNYFEMKEKDRKLLQIIGTDAGRQWINPNIWVNRFKEDIQIVILTSAYLNQKVPNFCSDDVRFKNEYEALISMGWKGIYLNCSDEIRFKRLSSRDGYSQEKFNNHASETGIDEFKDKLIKLDAEGSMETMLQKLEIIIHE